MHFYIHTYNTHLVRHSHKAQSQGRNWGGGGGGHVPPTNFLGAPPHTQKKSCVYIFLFANIARELILCAPTKSMLMYS